MVLRAQCSHMFLEGSSGAVRLVLKEATVMSTEVMQQTFGARRSSLLSPTVFAAFHRRMFCTFSAVEKKVGIKEKPISTVILKTSFLPRSKEVSCLVSQ